MNERALPCFQYGNDPCECSLPTIDIEHLRQELQRVCYDGQHYDRCRLTWRDVAALLEQLPTSASTKDTCQS